MGISNSVKGTQWKTNLFYTKKQFYILMKIRIWFNFWCKSKNYCCLSLITIQSISVNLRDWLFQKEAHNFFWFIILDQITISALKRKVLSNLHLKLWVETSTEWKLFLFIENISKGIHYLKNAFVPSKYSSRRSSCYE